MNPLHYALLADLLTSLETDGNPAGPDLHLRLQSLVRQLPADTDPADLKTVLAPVLCRSKEEQERFYELFERSWARVKEVGVIEEKEVIEVIEGIKKEERKQHWNRQLAWGMGVLLLALMGWSIRRMVAHQLDDTPPLVTRSAHNVRVGETDTLRFDTLGKGFDRTRFSHAYPAADSAQRLQIQLAPFQGELQYTALREGIDSVPLAVYDEGVVRRRHIVLFNVLPAHPETDLPQPTAAAPDTEIYQERPLPYPRDLSQLLPPQPTRLQQFLADYEWPLKTGAILLLGLLLWLLARWVERRRRQLIAEHQPNSKPPYFWNIELGAEPDVAFGDEFYSLLHLLRRRETDEQWRLDMPRTIRATIQKGGLPEFRYAQQTRPAEYLLLIDRQGGRDHRARLFEALFRAFRAQDILIEAYYFDGDPRLCWNDAHPQGLTLRELHYHHPQSRLLLLSAGWSLLNPQTGRPAKWTNLFTAWPDRAVLTPQPLSAWGRRERALRDQFLVLPVALSGLRDAVEHFDADDQKEPNLDPRRFADAAREPIQLVDNDLMKTLGLAFQPQPTVNGQSSTINLTTWVAACAVYPELHWDLTLHLGQLLSTPETHLPTAANLAELCRLPWFVEGKMPKEAREILLAWLEREQPETLLRIREGLHQLLAQNPPSADSAAHDDYALNMAVNEWLFTRDRRRKKQLEREVAARLAAGQEADFTVIKVLDRPRGPLDFVVPRAWRRFVYHSGMKGLGMKAWWWAGAIWLVGSGLVLAWQPEKIETCGNEYKQERVRAGLPASVWELDQAQTIPALHNFLDKYPNMPPSMQDTINARLTILDSLYEDAVENALESYEEEDHETGCAFVKIALRIDPDGEQAKMMYHDFDCGSIASGEIMEMTQASGRQWQTTRKYTSKLVIYKAVEYCLKRAEDELLLDEVILTDGLKEHRSLSEADSIWGSISLYWQTLDISAYSNITTAYFNAGVHYRLTRPEADTACLFFKKAQELNALLPDTAQLWYVRAAARACDPVTCCCCVKEEAGRQAYARRDYRTAIFKWKEGLKECKDIERCPKLDSLIRSAKNKQKSITPPSSSFGTIRLNPEKDTVRPLLGSSGPYPCCCCIKEKAGQAAFDRGDYRTAIFKWTEGLEECRDAAINCPELSRLIINARTLQDKREIKSKRKD